MRHAVLDPAEWPALATLLGECFGIPADRWGSFRQRIGDANFRTVHVDGTLAGGLGVYRTGQVFGGRSVPLGGLAGVGVAPEHRGAGVAAEMVASTLEALRDDGVPLAGLYASTQRLYRSVGFEQAGNRVDYEVPLRAIGVGDRNARVERVQAAEIVPLYQPVHGNLDRSPALWDRILHPNQGESWAFRVGNDGYAVLGQEASNKHYDVLVRDWQAHTPRAARRLWTLLADHSSLRVNARWCGPAVDPRLAHLPEQSWKIAGQHRWMLRILDVPGVLTARGWPAGEGELHLDVSDPILQANTGPWVLTVADGRAEVHPGGRGDLRTGIAGLAPLYSGLFDPATLRRIGWIDGPDDAIATATRLFAGPEPWMPEMY
jgi:predicted acetyltransferase